MVAGRAIHVLPVGHDDWVVREESDRELGHYPTAKAAETVGHKLALKRRLELVVHSEGGKVQNRSRPRKGWLSRLFDR
jgi:hypothetical protein